MGDSRIVDEAKRVRERANAVSFDFSIEELELGSTFCRIALGAHSERDYKTNHANADKAYQTALHHVRALELSDAERKLFEQKLHQLKLLLGELALKISGQSDSQDPM
jgi:hypothetical protein